MKSRRDFLKAGGILTGSLAAAASPLTSLAITDKLGKKKTKPKVLSSQERFDPWIEVIPGAIKNNARVLHQLSGNKPVMAVVKNNGYGLGDVNVARILDDVSEIVGFAAVKTEAVISIKESGVKKPVLHMGMATDSDFEEMVARGIHLSIYEKSTGKVLKSIFNKQGRPSRIHFYIDTGMSRMGIPYYRAFPWIIEMATSKSIEIQGIFMGFTEEPDYDKVQLERFTGLSKAVSAKGVKLGRIHAASSNGIYHFPEAALDMVRPGISLYGAYPTYFKKEQEIAPLEVAYKLKTRVVRVEKLRKGDSVSYGRNYIAEKPVWVATLPIGHTDGYPRNAVRGAKVMVNDSVYPVIGAVSASHTIIELGETTDIKVGDIATLTGPDHLELHPNYIAETCGISVYDVLMHLNPRLPKFIT